MKKKKAILGIIVLAVIIIAVVMFTRSGNQLTGQFEAKIVPNVSEVSGKLVELRVELGQQVKAGDVLAVIDSGNQSYNVEQLEIKLEQAMLARGDAAGGSGSSSGNALLAAQSEYKSAAAAAAQAGSDYQKTATLYAEGAVTKDALDKSRLAADTASYAASAAKAKLSTAGSDYSEENAGLSVALTQSQLQQARDLLDKYTISASCDGIVTSTNFTEGYMIGSGYDIVDIASDKEHYLVVYLPEDKISKYGYGQTLSVKYGGNEYEGAIKYIDQKAGYTPKDLQTTANKNKDSFKVKLLLPADCPIKAGEKAGVLL